MLPERKPPCGRLDRTEQRLVDAVWAEVRDRQAQSLHHALLLTPTQAQPAAPLYPWQGQLWLQSGVRQALSSPTTVADVFEQPDINRQLLILGGPGAGKTTVLLALATNLIQRANAHPQVPIPVMVHLAAWRPEQHTLPDWLRTELRLNYGCSASLANQWLQANTLVPLLDGLDEMPPDRQAAAVEAINAWLKSNGCSRPILVCSRRDDYQRLPAKLGLPGVLDLQPLGNQPLETYLKQLGVTHLWAELQRHPDLLDLIRTPLWLSLFLLCRDALPPAAWDTPATDLDRQTYLLDTFILQQLHKPMQSQVYASHALPRAQQTRHWLRWLAQQLQRQGQDEFLIETMQPDMLSNSRQRKRYSLLGGLIFGLTGGLIFGLWVGLNSGLVVSSLVGVLFLLTRGDDAIATLDELERNFTSFMRFILVRQFNQLLLFILIIGLMFGLATRAILGLLMGLLIGALIGLIVRASITLPTWLLGGVIFGVNHIFKADISGRPEPNQGILDLLRYSLRVTAMFVPLLVLIKVLPLYWSGHLTHTMTVDAPQALHWVGLIVAIALWATIFDSALVCAQHLALRMVLYRANAIPWNYARFLTYGCEHLLLQRVGGRYRFIHRLVQEHFANRLAD